MNAQSAKRLEALQGFIVGNQEVLTTAIFEAYPDALYSLPEGIIKGLIRNLAAYDGPTTLEPFLSWAVAWVQQEADRHRFTLLVYSEYALVIHAAIHDYLWTSYKDYGVSHDDLFAEIILVVFSMAHELSQLGTAKLSTRLTELVKTHVGFHNIKNHRRRKLVTEKIERIPDSIRLSDDEIASMQPKPKLYEPGYSECALN